VYCMALLVGVTMRRLSRQILYLHVRLISRVCKLQQLCTHGEKEDSSRVDLNRDYRLGGFSASL